ncbi:MAG: adenylate cyclase, partial [Candidatus Latescibacteria bacterium]|nr:adenylate cyclase [Candidatus Latescibacterota bacterium]
MPLEIERKFLVADPSCIEGAEGTACKQGYLSIKGEAVVRARIEGRRAVLTLKGRTRGIARSEYEYEIPLQDGEEILAA